ncbi:metallopeptidase family protein [Microlunatus capsulatus]|uniref:Zn-dependent protease with MMP-like domain n=1 Tax=Microlunatus capsulatus TaxID=99117 RepID=A0ABS4Z6H6_9ACTN|nr:metallopeptidase family protein [Microlunatus capsulatus]MBP2416330.1 putative Zn-dependent protease with MMP-like domain [Microlunatus capsulatus]
MSNRRRDRHGRGLRGPLAAPSPLAGRPANPPRPASPAEAFHEAVHAAVERVARACPDAVAEVAFGIEEVPVLEPSWTGPHVPLALAVEATADRPAQLVVYRRPLEHRASSRRGLALLVHRTVVEQLAALTGRSVDELDPDGLSDEDDD